MIIPWYMINAIHIQCVVSQCVASYRLTSTYTNILNEFCDQCESVSDPVVHCVTLLPHLLHHIIIIIINTISIIIVELTVFNAGSSAWWDRARSNTLIKKYGKTILWPVVAIILFEAHTWATLVLFLHIRSGWSIDRSSVSVPWTCFTHCTILEVLHSLWWRLVFVVVYCGIIPKWLSPLTDINLDTKHRSTAD